MRLGAATSFPTLSTSARCGGLAGLSKKGEEPGTGYYQPVPEAERRNVPAAGELVAESPGDPKEARRLGDA